MHFWVLQTSAFSVIRNLLSNMPSVDFLRYLQNCTSKVWYCFITFYYNCEKVTLQLEKYVPLSFFIEKCKNQDYHHLCSVLTMGDTQ